MKTILIVDDEELIRTTYKQLLTDEGYLVFEAANAVEACARLSSEKVDLVLLDINMPEVNGIKLYSAIDFINPETRVIVSSIAPLSLQQSLIESASDYYNKLQSLDVLLEKINRVLGDGSDIEV